MKGVLNSFTNLCLKKSPCREFRLSAGLRKAEIPNFGQLQGCGMLKFGIPSIYKSAEGRNSEFQAITRLRKAGIPNFSHLQGRGLMKFRTSSKYSLRKGRVACFSHLQGCGRLMQPAPANYKDAEGWGRLHRTIKNAATCTEIVLLYLYLFHFGFMSDSNIRQHC